MPRNPKDKTTENPVKLAVLEYLLRLGHYAWRNNTGAARYGTRMVFYGKVGSSDILGVEKGTGRIICIETKRPNGTRKVTDEQKAFLREVLRCGGLAGVAMDLEDVDLILAGRGSETIPE